jgi:hypothetical protein
MFPVAYRSGPVVECEVEGFVFGTGGNPSALHLDANDSSSPVIGVDETLEGHRGSLLRSDQGVAVRLRNPIRENIEPPAKQRCRAVPANVGAASRVEDRIQKVSKLTAR